jgi:ATP-dependent Lon protease
MAKKDILYPLVPLRDVVVFPKMIMPLFVGREKSIKAIKGLKNKNSTLILVSQKDSSITDPKQKDIYKIGVIAKIIQTLSLPDGTLKVLVEALHKVEIINVVSKGGYLQATPDFIKDVTIIDIDTTALVKSITKQFQEYSEYNAKINQEVLTILNDIKDANNFADVVASNLNISVDKKQTLLEVTNTKEKLKQLSFCIEYEINLIKTEQRIRDGVKKQMESTQREYFLNEQLKAIHKELGAKDNDGGESETFILEEKIKKTKLSKDAREKATTELKKLKMTNAMSSEATIIRNYLEYLLDLPWGKYSKLKHDISKAEKILNRDHYGLDKVKERVLEFLAVQNRTKSVKGPILCFVGPPGVGKTSLAKSISEATGRELVRFALGGIRDEAEIRGHRKTYIGAMPGRIISLLKKAKTSNPIMLLDEVDKIGTDYRGDPSSALLEVLDPEQNDKFTDHYIETEFDLSKVLFVATANSTKIPQALLDRMEVIRISGYTEDEKTSIALNHLLSKQREDHKLLNKEFSVSKEAITDIVRHYTREAGVRNLNRELACLARKAVKEIEQNDKKSVSITPATLEKFLGVKKFDFGKTELENIIGTTTGLAYTDFGGELLSIEAVVLPGKGEIKSTGKLGEVMKESAQAAFSYFKATSLNYGITPPKYSKKDIHLHVPEGATPKDGPSAGIAILTSIVSAITNIPVDKNIAMTGEITLRGRVLPIGGLKEKLLAAGRGGVKTVLIPQENEKDLLEIPKNITKNLEIIPVKTAEEVLKRALTSTLLPVEWSENDENPHITPENATNDLLTH